MIVNIGIDSADVTRFARLLEQDRTHLFSTLFGEDERAALPTLAERREASFVAGRWAAKEAVLKALGTGIGPVSLPEVGVFAYETGQPYISLYGKALKHSQDMNIDQWHISITHVKDVATAYVIAENRCTNA